ncbi:MAG: type II toxin-antitoxin system RelE/ParE family toxin [Synergistaceae bacterium]|nr:type II toxin-antitoxin system RelE/ParE family toxin [Synergistaceae bacterium]
MAHSIRFKSSAEKELDALSTQQRPRILSAIMNLANNPRPFGCKKLKTRDAYRIRVGDYRVIYEIHDEVLVVLVIRIAHRRGAYKQPN